MIEIVVLGVPVAKGRPRFAKATGHTYTPEKTRNFEAALKYAAEQVMGARPPLDGPLTLEIDVRLPIAPSWPKKRQDEALSGKLRPTKKPDFDNYAKTVDALNMVVWVDDGQVVEAKVSKHYSNKPGMWIRVRPLQPEEGIFG